MNIFRRIFRRRAAASESPPAQKTVHLYFPADPLRNDRGDFLSEEDINDLLARLKLIRAGSGEGDVGGDGLIEHGEQRPEVIEDLDGHALRQTGLIDKAKERLLQLSMVGIRVQRKLNDITHRASSLLIQFGKR